MVVVNHISHLDPMTFGLFLYDHGRLVRYLTKEALFRTPLFKYVVKDAGQIPVTRMTEGARQRVRLRCRGGQARAS